MLSLWHLWLIQFCQMIPRNVVVGIDVQHSSQTVSLFGWIINDSREPEPCGFTTRVGSYDLNQQSLRFCFVALSNRLPCESEDLIHFTLPVLTPAHMQDSRPPSW